MCYFYTVNDDVRSEASDDLIARYGTPDGIDKESDLYVSETSSSEDEEESTKEVQELVIPPPEDDENSIICIGKTLTREHFTNDTGTAHTCFFISESETNSRKPKKKISSTFTKSLGRNRDTIWDGFETIYEGKK